MPLEGVRVVELAQYVAGPLTGLLLGDLGADVIKVEPPAGDGYRHVAPVAPGLGRYFIPLNRGKRSVVLDLKTQEGRLRCRELVSTADVVLHNYLPERARAFDLDWADLHERHPALVVGVVSAFGSAGPLAGTPAFDLVAQARAGLLTAHASSTDRVPTRAAGIPIADLTAGLLLASGVLAALVRAQSTGKGELVETSLLAAALAVQVQDVTRLPADLQAEAPRLAVSSDLDRRAGEIARGLSLDPYYRCYAATDGFVAVACLNRAQRESFLALLGLSDATVAAPDLVPDDPALLTAKQELTLEVERLLAGGLTEEWLARLEQAGVPCGPVFVQESALADPQAVANGLVATIDQPGLGPVTTVGPLHRIGGEVADPNLAPAPLLGAHSDEVLAG